MAGKVSVLRAPGTNCDRETAWCLKVVGLEPEVIHVNRFFEGKADFTDYEGLVIPGGFSFGDHVRAGALLGKVLLERFGDLLQEISGQGKPILGICNGFQVLVECGLLPGNGFVGALTTNLSSKFECRWVNLKVENSSCIFTREFKDSINLPVAHGEGRFLVEPPALQKLNEKGQIALRYCGVNGEAGYPYNPNGSLEDIAGICNSSGNVFGLMPHPERAFYSFTHPDWTRKKESPSWGDGYKVFKSMAQYILG